MYLFINTVSHCLRKAYGKLSLNGERICYYELLPERDITEAPQYEPPDRYCFVSYTDNDRDAWIDIEMSARELVSYEQGHSPAFLICIQNDS